METATLADEAAFAAFLPALRNFVVAGADPDADDMNGGTPLFKVFANFDRRLPAWKTRFIIRLGGDIDKQDARSRTALMLAAEKFTSLSELTGYDRTRPGMIEDLTLLLDLGADPGLVNNSGQRAYGYFVPSETFPVDHPLVARLNARASYKGKFGTFEQSTPDEIREALAGGFDPNGVDHRHVPYLCGAVKNPDPNALAVFLNAGADPNLGDKDGKTPLMIAADLRDSSAIAELLRHGARVDSRDNIGMEATHALFRNLHRITEADLDEFAACLQLLLDAGSDPEAESNYGQTPFSLFMHYFVAGTDTPKLSPIARGLRVLAARGVDFFKKDGNGMSAPMRALCEGKIPWRVVDLYRELGWDVDEADGFGITPLMRAASFRNTDIHYGKNKIDSEDYVASGVVDGLADLFAGMMDRGADPTLRNAGGITALEHLAPDLQEHLLNAPTGERLRRSEK